MLDIGKQMGLTFQHDGLAARVTHILTEAILEGVIKGGQKLVETELQKQFGISRSPLREAYRSLEKKGLVVIVPRKGAYVRRITVKDIRDNFPVRAALEGLAAKMAKPRMQTRDLEAMHQVLDRMSEAVTQADTKLYWRHHLVFHDIFIKASDNDVLISTLNTLRMHSLWYRLSYKYYQEDLTKQLAVHQGLYEMFAKPATDEEELFSAVKSHVETAFEKFVSYLNETQTEPDAA